MEIKIIKPSDLYHLRNVVLRPEHPIESTYYDKDYDKETIHLGVFKNEFLVCVGTFYPEELLGIYAHRPYRLRGMATSLKNRRKGYASHLMKKSFELLKLKGADFIWCKARIVAIPFYQSLDFNIIGERYDIPEIGMHYNMYKILT